MTRCDYAGCMQPGYHDIDGWAFCTGHADTHHEDKIGAPEPDLAPPPPPPVTCGTMPGWGQHQGRNERPCLSCHRAWLNSQKGRRYRQRQKVAA